MTRIWLLLASSVLLAGVGAGEAHAAQRVKVGGVTFSVPKAVARGAQVVPGSRIVVRVVRNRADRRATVTLDGPGSEPVKSRKLSHGAFRVKASTDPVFGNHLRIRVGRKQRRYTVKVSAAKASARLALASATVRVGGTVRATVTNTGRPALRFTERLRWEAKQADGTYAPDPRPVPVMSEGLYLLEPGASRSFTGQGPLGLAPGVYRAVVGAQVGLPTFDVRSADVTVTP